jgi:hypothetical protein
MLILSLCLFNGISTAAENLLITLRNLKIVQPFTVAVRSKARTVFARSNTAIVGLSPTRDIDVYLNLYSVCVVLFR